MKETALYRDSRYASVPKLYYPDIGFIPVPVCPDFNTMYSHVVHEGETIQSLAEMYYGDSSFQWAFIVANDLGFPIKLPVGRTILVPDRDEVLQFVYGR